MTSGVQTATEGQHDSPSPSAPASTTAPPLSDDWRRTLWFLGGAAGLLLITLLVNWSTRPAKIGEYGDVGKEFYPEFADPTLATALEVFVFDAEKVQPLDFQVKRLDNGRWVIPSHHDYPADAEEQLAKTAASTIGIRRGAMVTRWPADHAGYGVVDPQQEALSVEQVEGIGKRIVLRGEGEKVLADYIIGKKVDEEQDNQYYVRRPDEDEVYITELNINLSTKFTDWIDKDLLDVDAWNVVNLSVNDYSFDELRGEITGREVTTLSRKQSGDPWTMDGLNAETEEVNADAVRETVDAIADLEIVGVRPKQKGLTPDLQLDRSALRSQADVDRLQSDLLTRGFLLQPDESGDSQNLQLISREGELYAAANDGLVYGLHFGRAFTGSQEELEIGLTSSGDEEESTAAANADADASSDAAAAAEDAGDKSAAAEGDENAEEDAAAVDDGKPGRYVFVRVSFDKKFLGEEPTAPVEPEKPAELSAEEQSADAGDADVTEETDADSAEADDVADDDNDAADAEAADAADEGETTDEAEDESDSVDADSPSDEAEKAGDADSDEEPLAEVQQKYEEAKQKYDDDLAEYERKSKEFNDKATEGQQKAEQLNRRFAEWYYVIPGSSYEKLKLSRADLVKPKEVEPAEKEAAESDEFPAVD